MRKRAPEPEATVRRDQQSSARSENDKTIAQLYREERNALIKSVWRVLPCLQASRDAVQEVFTRLLERCAALGNGAKSKQYLRAAVRNEALDGIRKRKCRGEHAHLLENYYDIAPNVCSPEHTFERDEQSAILKRSIEALPEEQRTALRLIKFEEMSYEDAARRMRREIHQVRRLVAKAMRRLEDDINPARGDVDEKR
jgi:RNA polymerase sigma-70 factor, ECF subfamily